MGDVDLKYDSSKNYDEESLAFERQIEKEVAVQQKLIGDQQDFSILNEAYKNDSIFTSKIKFLSAKYSYMRPTRGDGNCFYRAFGFAYMECILNTKSEFEKFYKIAEESKDKLLALNFPQFTIEDFHENFMSVLNEIKDNCGIQRLLEIYNDQGHSDYLVVYFRLIVSGYLQQEGDFFLNFIEGERGVAEFCKQEVEPMGKESDHMQAIGLSQALNVSIRIEYMDRGSENEVISHVFPEDTEPIIDLLYRPGHYDILYM